jgi:hypothetical protein
MKLEQPETDRSAYDRALVQRTTPTIAVIALACVALALAALLYPFPNPPPGQPDTRDAATSVTLVPGAPRKPWSYEGEGMGSIVIFPQDRVVRTLTRSSRIEELEQRILELLRLLRHRNSDNTVSEILRLREEIWRIEADEATSSEPAGWPRGH